MSTKTNGEGSQAQELSPLKKAFLAIDRLQARVRELEDGRHEPIAVVGLACRFPGGASSPERYAELLRATGDAVVAAPPVPRPGLNEAIERDQLPPAGYLREDVAAFDPVFFGVAPREAASMDPQQRLVLECAWEALEDAAINPRGLEGSRTGVFVGVAATDWSQLQMRGVPTRDAIHPHFAAGVGHSMASGRISYLLGLQGPSVSIDTACSSSLVSLHLACQSLRTRECDLALGAGVNLILAPDFTIAFQQTRMLSEDGRCRTFDADATGFTRGEGCGVVVLKRLRDALRDGDRIHAVVRGSAVNQDGPSSGLTAPNGPAQEAVIRAALESSGVQPAEVAYVEAHGTGTILGDPIEVQALGATYGRERNGSAPLLIGSVKTNLGHLEAAAGMAGFIKAVLAVRDDFVPAQLHFSTPNPHIPWDRLPVRVVAEPAHFPAGAPRRAGVSSFGFSGTNAHVIVEEPPAVRPAPAAAPMAPRAVQVLPLSAVGEAALRDLAVDVAALLEADPSSLRDLAHTAAVGRAPLRHRLVLAADDGADAAAALRAWFAGDEAGGVFAGRAAPEPPSVAFLYTGQGSQRPGMARELYDEEPVVREVLDRAAAVLDGELGRPFLPLLFGEVDDPETLHRTAAAQPAIMAVELALSALWRSWGIRPDRLLGHSVGEYAAAVDAGVMSFEDGLRLIAARGRLMDGLPEGGAMVALFAGAERVRPHLAGLDDQVSIAAINAPDSTVISGDEAAVLAVTERLAAEGVQNRRLNVSHAFHSRRMEPMLDGFRRVAASVRFSAPRVTVISNVTGRPLTAAEAVDPEYWVRHVRAPVLFHDGVEAARAAGVGLFLECGPEGTLCGMASRFLPEEVRCIATLRSSRSDRRSLAEATAALFAAGVTPDWKRREEKRGGRRVAFPISRFERTHLWYALPTAAAAARVSGPAWQTSAHPILGPAVRVPDGSRLFERTLEAGTVPFIADHRVDGRVIVPATVHVELMLAAGRATTGDTGLSVADVTIREAMVLEEGAPRSLMVRVEGEEAGGVRRVTIHSLAEGEEEFRLHAEGSLSTPEQTLPEALDLGSIEARCGTAEEGDSLYRRLAGRGLDFGPAFQGVAGVRFTAGEAVATLAAPDVLGDGFRLHPATLDAAIQAMAVAIPEDSGSELFLPVEIGRVRFFDGAGGARYAHARVQRGEGGGRTLAGSVLVYDVEGSPVAAVEGIRLVPVTDRRAGRADSPVYRVGWEARPRAEAVTPALLATAGNTLALRGEETGAAVYDALHRDLESLSADFFLRALRQLGWDAAVGDAVDEPGLMAACGILPRHQRLVRRILRVLEGAGVLSHDGDGWRVAKLRDPGDPDARAAELIARYAPHDAELTVTARCGAGLADVLRGAADPLELLFPGGDTFAQSRVYRDTPIAHSFNGAIAAVVGDLVQRRREGAPLRILEIGAGTGGTTAHVLEALPDAGVEYTFTDIGRLFVNRGRESFGYRPFMRFETLDIDRDPEEQGFDAGAYDLIIASNVLHATRLLRPTLQRVRRLLAPGGHLCLFEVTRERAWVDLTVGLLEGWWLYEDTDLRVENPVLDRAGWAALLESEGFTSAGGTDETDGSGLGGQSIILARRPAADPTRATRWLVFGEGDPAAAEFAARLQREGADVRLASTPVADEEGRRQLDALLADFGAVSDVVLFYSPGDRLDVSSGGGVEALRAGLGGALALVQGLVRREGDPPRLHLVTRGGQAAAGDVEPTDPAQATLWGLARSIRLEHPELRCRCVDLDPAQPGWSDLVHAELTSPDHEDQVAFRNGERRVARLLPVELPTAESGPRQLVYGSSGLLEDVRLVRIERRPPEPREIEVEVLAAGLNFRDVVHALGVRQDVEALGTECVGRVVARGEAVDHLEVGDLVIAAGGRFGDYTTIAADLAVRLPAELSLLQAATIPIAYLTAHRALHGVAGMRPGQRILVHAAAGGVGMAAVQLAVAAGLEVYGTAGNESKRALVRSLGARAVFDSRSLGFEQELLEATGGAGVDFVLNSLAGEFIPASLRVIREGGMLVELGKTGIWTDAQVASEPGVRAGVRYVPVDLSDDLMQRPEVIRPVLQEILDRVASGELRPLPVRSFPLTRAEEAFRFMAAGRHTGKVVLVANDRMPVREDGSYLVTGGFGGLGLLVAQWLADRGARSLILLGRSAPGDEARQVVEGLRGRGVRVETVQADVSDSAAVAAALESLADAPPVRGVIHSAGALRDAALVQQSWDDFAEVLASKAAGVQSLAAVAEGAPLDFFLIFSSIAGTLGSPGQANHAAANAFLDAFAVDRVARGEPAVSIAWGAWGEVGAAVRHGVNTRAAGRGIGTIEPAEGLRLMESLGASGLPVAVVSPIRWEKFLGDAPPAPFFERVAPVRRRRSTARAAAAAAATERAAPRTEAKRSLAEELAELPPARRRNALKERIRGAVRRVLGLPAGFDLDDRQALGDIGLDSLMAVELRNALGSMVGRSLPATLLFDYPTVGALTGYIEPSVITAESPAAAELTATPTDAPAGGGVDELDDLLGQIENLSETEVAHRVRKVETSPHV